MKNIESERKPWKEGHWVGYDNYGFDKESLPVWGWDVEYNAVVIVDKVTNKMIQSTK